jgi:hypothetical protein
VIDLCFSLSNFNFFPYCLKNLTVLLHALDRSIVVKKRNINMRPAMWQYGTAARQWGGQRDATAGGLGAVTLGGSGMVVTQCGSEV